jgi:two-component system chemotaxis sensor kinase CheA
VRSAAGSFDAAAAPSESSGENLQFPSNRAERELVHLLSDLMSIPSESFQALEDAINRLATESILAQVGRDDGLVPAYSLLGDLRELCSTDASLRDPIVAAHVALERLLDTAHPFDEGTLGALQRLVEWLPVAVECVKSGNATPPLATSAAAADSATGAVCSIEDKSAPADVMLVLHLEDNQELLGEFYGEAVDHLQQIEAALLALDQQPDNPEALN